MANKTSFGHSVTAHRHLSMIKVRVKFGLPGVGIFWDIIEILFENFKKLPLQNYLEIIENDLNSRSTFKEFPLDEFIQYLNKLGCVKIECDGLNLNFDCGLYRKRA